MAESRIKPYKLPQQKGFRFQRIGFDGDPLYIGISVKDKTPAEKQLLKMLPTTGLSYLYLRDRWMPPPLLREALGATGFHLQTLALQMGRLLRDLHRLTSDVHHSDVHHSSGDGSNHCVRHQDSNHP
ncbi:MAG: hypothetical protein SFZ03_04145 [Candidatus Melainabacteria bacterium]|nr:hypothetical protein [Candidatus Melainabacteria bacterium]